MKRQLLIFVSEAGAGKDFLLNKCVQEFGWSKVVSHTTRPIRESIGELDGVDYHFISDSEFFEYEENNNFIETTSYKTVDGVWYYGFHKDSIEGDGIKCLIMNPHGINQIIEKGYSDRMLIIYVNAPMSTRVKRYHKRLGDNPTEHQLSEGFLRLLRDMEDFEQFDYEIGGWDDEYSYREVPVDIITNDGDDDLNYTLNEIKTFVEAFNEN
jgi:guanylate kinase